jgi:hypothetical protein
MELDEPVEGDDRIVVLVVLVVGVGRHELGLGGPHRIGVLAVDLVELLGRGDVALGGQGIDAGIVDLFDRPLDIDVLVIARAGREGENRHGREAKAGQQGSFHGRGL